MRARRAQDRAAVMAAAARLFTANGWAATGMRDVARAAGGATETGLLPLLVKRVRSRRR